MATHEPSRISTNTEGHARRRIKSIRQVGVDWEKPEHLNAGDHVEIHWNAPSDHPELATMDRGYIMLCPARRDSAARCDELLVHIPNPKPYVGADEWEVEEEWWFLFDLVKHEYVDKIVRLSGIERESESQTSEGEDDE